MVHDLAYVTAQKLNSDDPRKRVGTGSTIRGQLLHAPEIGRPMVILRDPYGLRITTTPVLRVLGGSDGTMLYVHTRNSVYILRVQASRHAR